MNPVYFAVCLSEVCEYFLLLLKQYLSLSEQTSDLHSVQMPAWIDSTVVMSYSDLLNYIPHIF